MTGEDVSFEELGGALTHATRSGVAHLTAQDETQLFALTRDLFSFIPQNNRESPAPYDCDDDPRRLDSARLDDLVPDAPKTSRTTCAKRSTASSITAISRDPTALRTERHRRLRPRERTLDRHRRQSAQRARGRTRHQVLGEGRPVRTFLRRVFLGWLWRSSWQAGVVRCRPAPPRDAGTAVCAVLGACALDAGAASVAHGGTAPESAQSVRAGRRGPGDAAARWQTVTTQTEPQRVPAAAAERGLLVRARRLAPATLGFRPGRRPGGGCTAVAGETVADRAYFAGDLAYGSTLRSRPARHRQHWLRAAHRKGFPSCKCIAEGIAG